MADFYKGQRVRIVAGSYKINGAGIYIEACGKASCRVKVNGDTQQERTIRLSSIQPFSPGKNGLQSSGESQSASAATSAYEDGDRKDRRAAMLMEIRSLKTSMMQRIDALEEQIMNLNISESI
jgi:hypothetical protein